MEKPKLIEAITEVSQIALDAAKLCVADTVKWVGEKVDDAMDVWGQETDEEVER